jgi:hypothetical protein
MECFCEHWPYGSTKSVNLVIDGQQSITQKIFYHEVGLLLATYRQMTNYKLPMYE